MVAAQGPSVEEELVPLADKHLSPSVPRDERDGPLFVIEAGAFFNSKKKWPTGQASQAVWFFFPLRRLRMREMS